MDTRSPLIGLRTAELKAIAEQLGEKPYRGTQLASSLYKRNAQSLEALSDLPAAFRAALAQGHSLTPLHVATHRKSTDGVEKLLVHNGDNQVFECVLLPYEDRVSCCISTQVGCPMGCKFCATGLGGFDRNLTAAEIVGQYHLLQGLTSRRISHIVFMGMGEPLLNLPAVKRALAVFAEEYGLSYRHITISTVGIVPQIDELAKLKLPIHLALSLHSPDDKIRSEMMPVNHKWPVAVVMDSMRRYQATTGRKITIEYLLINDLNDTAEQAAALAELVRGVPSVVNIIPWNWVDTGNGYARPTRGRVRAFINTLRRLGVNVTERTERGQDIAAACGQLAGQHQGRFAKRKETQWELTPLSSSP